MFCIHMLTKVKFALKRVRTVVAGEGLEAGVLLGVGDEVGGLTERLSTQSTLIGFLT